MENRTQYMKDLLKNRIGARFSLLLTVALSLGAVQQARAGTEHWIGNPGVTATTNWSDSANWTGISPPQTYYNEVDFWSIGAVGAPGVINNVLDSTAAPGPAQMPIWQLDYIPTNANFTTLINPGVTMQIAAGNGNLKVGADILTTGTPAPANAVETITITGPGATLNMTGGSLYVGQGSVTPYDTHNVTLDLSGLDNFVMTPSTYNTYIYLASSAAARANGVLYLAKTNNIVLSQGIQTCNQSSSSNSQPIILYLGISNSITLGSSGNFNIGQTGVSTNGVIVAFNPAFLGGANPPTAIFNSSASGGRIGNIYICNTSQAFNSYALCNLSGGSVNALVSTLYVAESSSGIGTATGVLTFDMGTINASSAYVGRQQSSGGGMAVGTVNINSNSTYGASATLIVGGTLSIGAYSGTLTSGTAGTININGGTLSAGTITCGTGTGAINVAGGTLTLSGTGGTTASPISALSIANSTLNLTVSSAPTNINTTSLTTGGAGNLINIPAAPASPVYPVQVSLIKYQGSIGGAGYNFSLGTLPALFGGYLSNNTANASVDLVLTNGPLAEIWSAAQNNNWDTTSTNWLAGGNPTTYADGDAVQFLDGASNGTVNLTATFNPNGVTGVTVSNNALAYTWSGSGAISGLAPLTKQGPGTLVIDNSGNNNFSGGVTLSGGILQVGNSDANGNLPSGNVTDNAILAYDRTDNPVNSDAISGAGAVVQAGGGTLQLAGVNTFTGPVVVTNNSTLQLGSITAAGAGTNAITVLSGSTLDINGYTATKPVVVSGTGVSGNGALIDSGGALYDNPGPAVATNILLAADTAFQNNNPNRWDLGSRNGTTCVLGGAHNLTLNGAGSGSGTYFEWANLLVTNVANITIASGTLGVVGTTTFGNPASTLAITPGATLQFYGANNVVNKAVDFQNGANIENTSSANVMNGAMTMEAGYCTVCVAGGTTLNFSNVLNGSGVFYQNSSLNNGSGTAILSGNSPSFTGGVLLYSGTNTLNGLIGSGITSQPGTTISGTGTANGLVDVSGLLLPGAPNVAGTFNAAGGLTLESGATVTMNLNTKTAPGGGTNSLVVVTGNLTFNGNNITINAFKGFLAAGTYTLFTYTGTLTMNGTLTASTVVPSRYTLTVATNATQVNLVVSGQGDLLDWNNYANNGTWDVATSVNWTNLTTRTNDQFLLPDTVLFDDTITNAAHPTTSITIPSGTIVVPNVMTNNSTTNYTISGAGQIGGAASIVKLGSSKLTVSNTNTFTGNITIGAGSLQVNGLAAAGATNGSLIISNGATLYINLISGGNETFNNGGFQGKPIIVAGSGVNGLGAIQSIGNALYNDSSTLGLALNVTLTGDTTIGANNRLDWGVPGATLSTGGSNYNLTVIENQYFQWTDLTIDTNLGNIDIYNSTSSGYTWAVTGMGGSLGNPTNTLTVHSNVTMEIVHTENSYTGTDSGYAKVIHVVPTATYYNSISGGAGDYRDSTSFILDGGSSFYYFNGTGGSGTGTAFSGPVTLNGLVNIQVGNSPITFSNVISGTGGFYVNQYSGQPPLNFAGTNTYQGITDLRTGIIMALIGNGSISSSTPISLASGAMLIVTNRTDGTLTLASGQTLEGVGIVNGKLAASAGSTVLPGATSTATNVGILTVFSNATLSGNALFKLNNTTNDVLSVGGALTYGGTLTLTNISATPLAAGKSFKLFNAPSYSGSFTLSPASPGSGLLWDTSQLNVSGRLQVISTTPPAITGIAVGGGNVILTGTNGSPNAYYLVLSTTNVAQPLSQWQRLTTNQFDGSGNFNWTNALYPVDPIRFYLLQLQ
jgi:autotransporter-associated beta strand protein